MKQETEVVVLKELLRQLDEGRNVDAGTGYRVPTKDCVCPDLAR